MNEDTVAGDLVTAKDFIRWGASRMNGADLFFGHGTADALHEAAALVLHVLDLPFDVPPAYLDARLTRSERQAVIRLLQQRIEGRTPAAYLTHEAWFAGRPYYVDERVLVPRSPIAELVERRFQPWLPAPRTVRRVLDLCAGGGCIGIGCAHVFPRAQVDLGDLSEEALEVAELNLVEHGLADRVAAIQSDLFAAFEGQRYDLIVSNPPYVGLAEMDMLPDEYHHEPVIGLEAGELGLDVVSRILARAADHLADDGVLVVEVGATWPEVVRRWPTVPFVWLTFRRGGEGVFLLTRDQLMRHQGVLSDSSP
jgi:ribosomal protein L3 glutamine methyltransferase